MHICVRENYINKPQIIDSMETLTEGKAKIIVDKERTWAEVSKKMPVFYNPQMKLNRDISVLLLNCVDDKQMQICDLLAGSGIRSIRFLKELKKSKIKEITINDYDEKTADSIKKNLKLNKIKSKDIKVMNKEANILLLESSGYDYIEIDPFGTPNPYLESAAKRIAREGILAVTATDTSALCGTYENACKRKYWAQPLRNELMHEIGTRILIRKVQLIGAHNKKALTPIFCHASDHYMRVYFRSEKGKKKVDEIIKQHDFFHDKVNDIDKVGPIWTGNLWDNKLAKEMLKQAKKSKTYGDAARLLAIIAKESEIETIGFYDIHAICKKMKIEAIKKELIMKKIKSLGHKSAETHFARNGLRSDIGFEEMKEILK